MVRKPIALLLMVISLLGVLSPGVLNAASSGQGPVLVTLDVCHTSTGLLDAASDVPVLHESSMVLAAWTVIGRTTPALLSSYERLVAFQSERPPEP